MILSLLEFLIIFFILILGYFNAKNFFFSFVFSFFLFGKFFLFKIGNVFAPTVFNLILVTLLILFVCSKCFMRYKKYFFLYLGVYILYFVFLTLLNRCDFISNLILYKNFFILSLFAILLIENIRQGKVNPSILINTLFVCLFIQSCLGIIQYFYPSLTDIFRITYEWGGEELGLTTEVQTSAYDIYVLGTLLSPAAFASYLMFSLTAVLFMDIIGIIRLNRNHFFVIILGSITLLLAGIRSPFLIYLMAGLYFLYKRYRKLFFPVILLGVFVVILNMTFLQRLNNVASLENPIERVISGFAVFSGDLSKLEGTTFFLVILMVPYVMQNPLFGVGLHNKSGYFLLNVTLEELSTTDSQLLFSIAEIGLVGLVLCLYPFKYIYQSGNAFIRKQVKIFLLLSLVSTLIDSGIFALNNMLIIFVLCVFAVTFGNSKYEFTSNFNISSNDVGGRN